MAMSRLLTVRRNKQKWNMPNFTEITKFAAADFRYHLTVLSGFVVGFLLLFVKDLPPYL